jgi:putative ABC transport system substrate-binding protein
VGQNLVIDYRFADGQPERLPQLIADLVRLNVDVLVVGLNPVAIAARQATATILHPTGIH